LGKREKILVGLLEQSGPKLHTLLLRLTFNEHTAEDLMQELFCRLWNVKDLSQVKNLDAYARQTAIRLAYDWLRSRKRNPLSLSETMDEPAAPASPVNPENREQLQQILDAAARLEGLMWDCFVMRYVEEMTYERIAAQLEKTPQQIRGLCSKAVRKIREIVNQEPTESSFKEAAHG
jgi:RNA polymerase sigma-70 factor (ECF subfamily)